MKQYKCALMKYPKIKIKNKKYNIDYKNKKLEVLLNTNSLKSIILSIDVDWAPNFIVEYVLEILNKNNACFFLTNDSDSQRDLIKSTHDIGYHFNLSKNSSQGNSFNEIYKYFNKFIKKKLILNRFHLLNHSYNDLEKLKQIDVKLDSSILMLNQSNILPAYLEDVDLLRIPYFWEDGTYLKTRKSLNEVEVNIDDPGCKIFDFHPIDIYFNTYSLEHRNLIKKSKKSVYDLSKIESEKLINKTKTGIGDVFRELLNFITINKIKLFSLSEANFLIRENL